MLKPERAPRECALAGVPRGSAVAVVALPAAGEAQLLVHGIRPGARLVVDGDAPFGGPRIVRLAGSRVAVDRRLARSIMVVGTGPLTAGGPR